MNVTFRCPRCDATVRAALDPGAEELACPACEAKTTIPASAIVGSEMRRCVVCPSSDLFVRKDFPQRLGVLLVMIGFAGFLGANFYYRPYLAFGFLFATAAIDVVLYFFMGETLVCYRCGAHYRGAANVERHGGFQLETHERYRQMAARLSTTQGGGRSPVVREPWPPVGGSQN